MSVKFTKILLVFQLLNYYTVSVHPLASSNVLVKRAFGEGITSIGSKPAASTEVDSIKEIDEPFPKKTKPQGYYVGPPTGKIQEALPENEIEPGDYFVGRPMTFKRPDEMEKCQEALPKNSNRGWKIFGRPMKIGGEKTLEKEHKENHPFWYFHPSDTIGTIIIPKRIFGFEYYKRKAKNMMRSLYSWNESCNKSRHKAYMSKESRAKRLRQRQRAAGRRVRS